MKVGDLVKNTSHHGVGYGWLGLVVEEEKYEGEVGTWVWYFEDDGNLRWHSFDERYNAEVISESR